MRSRAASADLLSTHAAGLLFVICETPLAVTSLLQTPKLSRLREVWTGAEIDSPNHYMLAACGFDGPMLQSRSGCRFPDEAAIHRTSGRYVEATAIYQKLLADADESQMGAALDGLGAIIALDQERASEAVTYLTKALPLLERALGP